MTPEHLTDDDLDTLMEALEAWEVKDSAGEMLSDVLEMAITGKQPGEDVAWAAQRRAQKQQLAKARTSRKERSVLLRAKLLTMRQQRSVDQVEAAMHRDQQ